MTVHTIRAHRRYALRSMVDLRREDGSSIRGLMIEISAEGFRISNLGKARFATGESVTLATDADLELEGTVRWAHDGIAGIRLDKPLHSWTMAEIIEAARNPAHQQPCYA